LRERRRSVGHNVPVADRTHDYSNFHSKKRTKSTKKEPLRQNSS
jgi:hypothetical protein